MTIVMTGCKGMNIKPREKVVSCGYPFIVTRVTSGNITRRNRDPEIVFEGKLTRKHAIDRKSNQ